MLAQEQQQLLLLRQAEEETRKSNEGEREADVSREEQSAAKL